MRKVILLGASGSIGKQTLDIIEDHRSEIEVVALSVGHNIDFLRSYLKDHDILCAYAIKVPEDIKEAYPNVKFYEGEELLSLLDVEYDLLINALVGFVGFRPTLKAIRAGRDVALANKESLVVGGELIKDAMQKTGSKLYPIDSEHSAIYQCLKGSSKKEIKRLIITASGGAFRDMKRSELSDVKKEDALKHPTWSMGPKITIDSATMMNKAFEIIEAHYLFDIPYEKIDVIEHRESIVHSFVEFNDGSILAQLSEPDMRLPISYALFDAHLPYSASKSLDLARVGELHFQELSYKRFPLLEVAKLAGKIGGDLLAYLDGANDTAVELFLKDRIPFLMIEEVIIECLKHFDIDKDADEEAIEKAYEKARSFTLRYTNNEDLR